MGSRFVSGGGFVRIVVVSRTRKQRGLHVRGLAGAGSHPNSSKCRWHCNGSKLEKNPGSRAEGLPPRLRDFSSLETFL
jgi:hypothetical protein